MADTSVPPEFDSPWSALRALTSQLRALPAESVDLAKANGRVLTESILADRPSPAADVSAMDGFAIRAAEITRGKLFIFGESVPGEPMTELPAKAAIRIATGGLIPRGADAVVRVEDAEFDDAQVWLKASAAQSGKPRVGDHIRKTGENVPMGVMVVPAGTVLNPPALATAATFGAFHPKVKRAVRVGIITTGDEVVPADQSPQPWQLRNANAATLLGLLQSQSLVACEACLHAPDQPAAIEQAMLQLLDRCDVVALTGGVSRGHRDHVPEIVQSCGGRTIFHRLPLRPGGPIFGAVGPTGQAILGLPGNPVSVLMTACFFLGGVCRSLAGIRLDDDGAMPMRLLNGQSEVQAMRYIAPRRWDFLPVRRVTGDGVELLLMKSSGDIAALSLADGYLLVGTEMPADGRWPYRPFKI